LFWEFEPPLFISIMHPIILPTEAHQDSTTRWSPGSLAVFCTAASSFTNSTTSSRCSSTLPRRCRSSRARGRTTWKRLLFVGQGEAIRIILLGWCSNLKISRCLIFWSKHPQILGENPFF
jgi:hypothetical protein